MVMERSWSKKQKLVCSNRYCRLQTRQW